MHLVTREAVALYLRALAERGLLAAHISNRYLDLLPVFGNVAREARLNALAREDLGSGPADADEGKLPSVWVVMARRSDDLGRLVGDPRWHPPTTSRRPVWTDDFSNVLGAVRW